VFWSIIAWIATSAVILATAPKTDAKFVFTVFTNETGWPDGVAWMLGLLQSAVMAKDSGILHRIPTNTLFSTFLCQFHGLCMTQ
jgi:hypothetical protein